jgi:hypothetical protein
MARALLCTRAMTIPRTRALALRISPPLALVALWACSAAPGDRSEASSSEIISGSPVANETLGSALLYYCPAGKAACVASTSNVQWLCSGTMVADRWLLTAHHCVTTDGESTTGGTAVAPDTLIAFQPGGQTSGVGVQVFRHPTLDVALIELSTSVVSPAGTIEKTPIYPSSEAGFSGKSLYCEGYGVNAAAPAPGTGEGVLRSAMMTVSGVAGGGFVFFPNATGQSLASGDSGAGCFLYPPGGGSPNYLVSVHSTEDQVAPGFNPSDDVEVTADGFASWATGIVAANACSEVGAACGTITDGFGAAVSCGACGTGDVCQGNQCVCAPKRCPAGATWNSETCECQLSCHSAITCCAVNGGTWQGGHCI